MPVAETIQSAQQFGPSIWFAVFIVLVVFTAGGAYMRYVHLPSQNAANENAKRLTDVVEKLTTIINRTDERTTETHTAVIDMGGILNAIAVAKSYEIDAIAKIAKTTQVDVHSELASIASLMKFVRAEYVSVSQPKP